jgi:hypothetical protein
MKNKFVKLSDSEVEKLNDDELMTYLDKLSEHLMKGAAPLPGYFLKRFAYMDADQRGVEVTSKHHDELNKLSIKYRKEANEKIIQKIQQDGL